MPEHEEKTDDASAAPGRRFKLPKLFADAKDGDIDEDEDEDLAPAAGKPNFLASASALGATLAPGIAHSSDEDDEPRATVLTVPASNDARSKKKGGQPATHVTGAQAAAETPELMEEISVLRSDVEEMTRILHELNERGLSQDKVFNTLHSELQDYKNDFLYEHLKPVVRPLLFLFDSLEQFDDELNTYERSTEEERRGGITPAVVRANIMFFREQLIEALRICEVTPMYDADDSFDPKLHKAIDTVNVEPQFDGTVQRVVKTGWYLNGRVFRPAEVVVGKHQEDPGVRV